MADTEAKTINIKKSSVKITRLRKRNKIRRGLKNSKKTSSNPSNNDFVIYQSNIRGFKSKAKSLSSVLDIINPNVVTLNEHCLKNNQKLNINDFKSYTRNRKNMNMGGVSISVKNDDAKFCSKSSEGKDNDEYLITHHNQFIPPLNIFAIYGETESRTNFQDAKDKWLNKLEELNKIENRNENVIFIGDFNKSIGNDDLGVVGGHDKISRGGHFVRDLLDTGKYVLANNSDKREGGPFTRYNPSCPDNDDEKSSIDFVIISKALEPYISKIIIDDRGRFTPVRAVKNTTVKPDHYPIIVTLSNLPLKKDVPAINKSRVIWNTNKVGGWDTYKDLTENSEEFDKIIAKNSSDPTLILKEMIKTHDNIKNQAFGKVKFRKKKRQHNYTSTK